MSNLYHSHNMKIQAIHGKDCSGKGNTELKYLRISPHIIPPPLEDWRQK